MRKIIAFLIAAVLIFSMSSVAFAGYHEYSGGANNYFDTRSLDRVLGATRETNAQVVQLKETVLTPLRINQRS